MLPAMTSLEPCPICGAGGLRASRGHWSDQTQYTLMRCGGCGVEHWQPLVAPRAAYYEGEQQAMYTALHEGRRRAEDDLRFSRFLAEFSWLTGKRLLDVGCADGALIDAVRARGNEVVGIDIDARSLRSARARELEVHETTLDAFAEGPAAGRRFDVVTMFDVLEHLTAPKRALEVARDLLVPGGHLVGTVPNRDRLFANLVDADFPPHHFLRFDKAAIDLALRSVGLVPERVEVFQWGYAGSVLLNATIRSAKKLARIPRRSPAGAPTPGAPVASAGQPAVSPKLKHRVAGVLNRSLGRILQPVEQTLDRGFKLYFVARRPLAS